MPLPKQTPEPLTSGVGYTAWETKRRRKFQRTVDTLIRQAGSLDELRLVAHELSDRLAEAVLSDSLPRRYCFKPNRDGDRTLALGDDLFGPAIRDPLPSARAIEQLGSDLKTGWLEEVL